MAPRILRSMSSGQQYENKKTFAVIILLISVLVVDTSLFRISDLIRVYVTSSWTTILFVFMSIVYVIGQHILIGFARTKSRQIRQLGYLHLNILDKSVTITQYLLSGIIVFVLLQVLIFSEFYTSAISMAAVISYLMAIFMIIFLSLRFFSWFRFHKSPLVLLYLLSTITLTINAVFILPSPFGLIIITIIGFSSYLMLIGIYSSAISVAQDSRIRRSIRKSIQQQGSLLDKIGTAQMQQEIENRVLSTIKSLITAIPVLLIISTSDPLIQ